MKALFLTGSILLTAVILVIAFGNINSQCTDIFFFFFPVRFTPTILILIIAVLGIITGMMYNAFLGRMFGGGEADEDGEF